MSTPHAWHLFVPAAIANLPVGHGGTFNDPQWSVQRMQLSNVRGSK